MELFETIKKRRSIRSYNREEVLADHLLKILEAGIWAPSAGNLQPWEFIVVRDERLKEELAQAAYDQTFISEAPVVIVICANPEISEKYYGKRGKELYCIQDTAAATENILLAACALGYGTCWVGAFKEDEVRRILRIPKNIRPVAIIPLGKPKKIPNPPSRVPLSNVVHYEVYSS